jgi:serine/threonine protein phosphatase PrpC
LLQPSRQDEESRIKALGGRVVFWGRWRVEGVLAVSRAIGDINLKPFVTCEPEILAVEMSEDDMFLVLATDGIWCVILAGFLRCQLAR